VVTINISCMSCLPDVKPNIFILGKELCQTVIILIHRISSIHNGVDPNDSCVSTQYDVRTTTHFSKRIPVVRRGMTLYF
jgi:hypothetical protein